MSKVSEFWKYFTDSVTKNRVLLEKLNDEDEVASMEIGVPMTLDRRQWLTQLANESKIAEGKCVYVTDQDNHWDAKREPWPGTDEDWRYIAQENPGYDIVDVHISDVGVHVYIKKKKDTNV
jgi:hypothetical protein